MPFLSLAISLSSGASLTLTRYFLGILYLGWMSLLASSPSLVRSKTPSASKSNLPMGKSLNLGTDLKSVPNFFTRSMTVGLPSGSETVLITPLGLLSRIYILGTDFKSAPADITLPSTAILSFSGSALVPSFVAALRLTVTLPSRIISSALRLDAIPACAIIFCNLSCNFFLLRHNNFF